MKNACLNLMSRNYQVLGLAVALLVVWQGICRYGHVSPPVLPAPSGVVLRSLLVNWFGYGLTSKVVITALICFFPILVSVISGFHSTDRDQLDMMKAYGTTTLQTLIRLRIPSALVLIFAGLEIASVLAVIGTIVGEFVGAQAGLGYLIMTYNFNLDITGVFAVLIILSAIGMTLRSITRFAGRRYIFWIQRESLAVVPH